MFIELHIIQSLPPSNPNRGQDGGPKSLNYGGSLRSRLSSQSQKRAAREWYSKNSRLPREQLAQRSRRWDTTLAPLLTYLPEADRSIAARLVLALFNTSADKLLKAALEPSGNLMFLTAHEVSTIAAITEQHQALLTDLVQRVRDVERLVADGKTEKSYDSHPSKRELSALVKALGQVSAAVPGDVALFGRMMAQLTEASVDGCVQVADAISVNAITRSKTRDGWKAGEIDFFSAMDDIAPGEDDREGAGMIGETTFTSPVYYRYANVCLSELIRLVGDDALAQQFAAAFLRGFAVALPSGMVASHAHMTRPEFILIQATTSQPYQHAPAFLNPINQAEADDRSISQQAVTALLNRVSEMAQVYGDTPIYQGCVGLSDHAPAGMAVSLDDAIQAALGSVA